MVFGAAKFQLTGRRFSIHTKPMADRLILAQAAETFRPSSSAIR